MQLTVFLCSFSTLIIGWVFWPVKTVAHITYTVLVETLNHAQSINQSINTLFGDHLDEVLEEDGHSLQYIAAATPCVSCWITTRHSVFCSRVTMTNEQQRSTIYTEWTVTTCCRAEQATRQRTRARSLMVHSVGDRSAEYSINMRGLFEYTSGTEQSNYSSSEDSQASVSSKNGYSKTTTDHSHSRHWHDLVSR